MSRVKRVKTDVEYATHQQRVLGGIKRSYVFAPGPDQTWRIIHVSKDVIPTGLLGKSDIHPWSFAAAPEEGVFNRSEVALIAVEDDGKLPWPDSWNEPMLVIERAPKGKALVAEVRKAYDP